MQYKKLFKKSEIEYITPFLKLWMSFNSWYKKDLIDQKIKVLGKDGNIKKNEDGTDKEKDIKTDSEAIKYYKSYGKIKEEFLRLFDDSSDLGIEFNIAIYELILNTLNYKLEYSNGDSVCYSKDLVYENIDKRSGLEPIYISQTKLRFQIPSDKKEELFSQSLEVIYQVRSNLVHGSFDIENQYFLKLIESSYKILYPIIERIFENENEIQKNKEYFDKNYFEELNNRINDLYSSEISPIRKIIELYSTSIDYDNTISGVEFGIITNYIYKNVLGKTVIELGEERGIGRGEIFNFLSLEEKEKLDIYVNKILFFAREQEEKQIPMTMKMWKEKIKSFSI